MNKNKGIIGIGLIMVIVLGVLVIAGGAYYLGVNQNKKVVDVPLYKYEVPTPPFLDESNYIPPTPNCNSNSPSTIKLISPNGGEVYKEGDKINVKWESCNIAKDASIFVDIYDGIKNQFQLDIDIHKGTINDGSEEFLIWSGIKSGSYILRMTANNSKVGQIAKDESDNKFTINSSTKTVSTTGEYGDDINGRHIGAIESIDSKNNLVIDYVQWISPCNLSVKVVGCENGYQIVNDSKKLRSFLISDSVLIKLQTYSHTDDGSFNWNQVVSLPIFKSALNSNILYWITLKDGKVVEITEQYQP